MSMPGNNCPPCPHEETGRFVKRRETIPDEYPLYHPALQSTNNQNLKLKKLLKLGLKRVLT